MLRRHNLPRKRSQNKNKWKKEKKGNLKLINNYKLNKKKINTIISSKKEGVRKDKDGGKA
jgi:hypothetical protein